MVSVMSLLVPVLLSGVIVFVASSLIHMVIGYHKGDFKMLPSEDEAMAALQKFNIPPGDYLVPKAPSMEAMKSPEFKAKWAKGPVMIATVMKGGTMSMGPQLTKWFVYILVVSLFTAYVTGRVHGPGTAYLTIFRTAGTVAFMGYTLAYWPEHIWYQRSLGTTVRNTLDGLLYGLLTAGVFGWRWPH
jgi:hypothetical protein